MQMIKQNLFYHWSTFIKLVLIKKMYLINEFILVNAINLIYKQLLTYPVLANSV